MKILIIGGTRFVGRHIVEELINRKHDITLFNRGNNCIFPELKTICGDRNEKNDINILAGENWDLIIDTCAYFPRQVEMLEPLFSARNRYVFISSISVYADQCTPNQNEDSPLIRISEETEEELTAETYGGFKALCEKAAEKLSASPLIIRPGIIVGPYDTSYRFTYWPFKIWQGEKVIAPDCSDAPIQFIDSRDLALFIADAIEKKISGTFNLISEPGKHSFNELLDASSRIAGEKAQVIKIPESFLIAAGVHPWLDLPFWIPESEEGFMLFSNQRAVDQGLKTRPIQQTVTDIVFWFSQIQNYELKTGMGKEKEALIILNWECSKPADAMH